MTDSAKSESAALGVYPGRVLGGRYRLESRIAAGGMAEVWEAVDSVLGRHVAVKLLHAHLATDQLLVQRFRTEAIASARLHHPSIVAIYDTISEDRTEAIVMELIRGRTLRAFLDERGPLEPGDAIDIGADVADALHMAHCAGVVHRDIKPANILLCDDDRVMVTDFGIAKVYDDTDLTQTGIMLGSVKYLSPEQVESSPVDGRSDIFSLGIVLYEGLTGRPPFTGDNAASMALARLHTTPPSPRQVRGSVPPIIDEIVMKCLRRDPAERFTTAAELRAALLGARAGTSAPVRNRRPDPDQTAMVDRTEIGIAPGGPSPTAPADNVGTAAPVRRRRRLLTLPVIVFLVLTLVSLAVAGVLVWRTTQGRDLLESVQENTGIPIPGAPEAEPLRIVATEPIDPPPGDGEEGNASAPQAIDGDPATGWSTEGYDRAIRKFGNIPKEGVGLWVKLESPATIRRVRVTTPNPGWSGAIYVADQPSAELFPGWGSPVATAENVSGDHTFEIKDAEGQYVLFWLSDPGTGVGEGRISFTVNEIEVLGG